MENLSKKGTLLGIAIYFASIYGIFFFASKGWTAGNK